MAERANPEDPGFKDRYFGFKKNRYKRKLYERYKLCNQYLKNKRVLDIPCGVGWGTTLLKGYESLVGIDISEEAIAYAKKHYERYNRKFHAGNIGDIPLKDNSMDIILCLEGFEHVSKDIGVQFISESKRVLKRNGLLVMTCPVFNAEGMSTGNPYHVYEYPEYDLIDLLNRNFSILNLNRLDGPDGPEYRVVLSNFKNERYIKND